MKNYTNKQIKINRKHIIAILIIVGLIIALCFVKILHTKIVNSKFSKQSTTFVENNEEPIFKISKILLYSNAGIVDNSIGEVLQDIDISQYTDISIQIDNKSKIKDLTEENTVKEIYIDNIKIETKSQTGERILNYKNPYLQGKYQELNNAENGTINFKVIRTKQENEDANYDEANFYTDCSNPISLGYINKNIVKSYAVSEKQNSVSYDGKLFKSANIKIDNINSKISFEIHIKNNQNKEFVTFVVLDNNLDNEKNEIYEGYVLKAQNTDDAKYNFIQKN